MNIYADVDPDAKMAAISNVKDSFDTDFAGYSELPSNAFNAEFAAKPAISFTVEQLRAMLAEAESNQGLVP